MLEYGSFMVEKLWPQFTGSEFSDILFTQASCLVMEMCKWENPILLDGLLLSSSCFKSGSLRFVVSIGGCQNPVTVGK